MVHRRVHGQLEAEDRGRIADRPGQRLVAPERGDLQRPDDAAGVPEIGAGGEGRRRCPQPGRQRVDPVRGQGCVQPRANRGVKRERVGVDAREHGAQPETGPAGEDADAAVLAQGRQGTERMRAEVGDRERLVRVHEVDAVVDDPCPLLGRGLGRADVQAAEHLSRVGGDDLGRDAACEQPFRERDGKAGLAGGGGSADDDERRERAQASVPRSA